MIELIPNETAVTKPIVKKMSEMKRMEVCVIVGHSCYVDEVVVRLRSSRFEVFSVSNPSRASWDGDILDEVEVRELRIGEKYTLELS